MNILIPMAGEGKRFQDAGYKVSKPAIPTYDRRSGKKRPMVVCAASDLPGLQKDGANILFLDRDHHKRNGTEEAVLNCFPKARFLTIDHLTEGQACTCLLAKDWIDNEEELFIAGCDNGMEYDKTAFDIAKQDADVLVFTYRNNEAVLKNPNAYGWVETDGDDRVVRVSVKQQISDDPLKDHAVVASFWYRRGCDFVRTAEEMIKADDRVNREFYVDQAINYAVRAGLRVKVFEVDRYICWGTPKDYEEYQKTFEYWHGFWNEIR